MASIEIKSLPATGHEIEAEKERRDEANLARLGKRPILKRNFGMMSMLGFSCTILITWEGIIVTFLQAFQNGGMAGAVYGFIIVWSGTTASFAVLSELASMAPTSGGQYHWCSMLAPQSWMRFFSYVTGWLTVIGWQATFATSCYLSGTLVQALVILTRPSYQPHDWHGTLLLWAVVLFSVLINAIGGNVLPRFEGMILIIHILGFFAILIPVLAMGEHRSGREVFTMFLNEGNFPTQGLSFFVGLIGCVFAFSGGDAAVHMSEEITNAEVVVPRSIMLSVLINGSLGFAMLLATLFSLQNIEKVLNTPTGYPFLEIILEATDSIGGTATLGAIVTTMGICTSVGMLAACSRQFWSFARDRGVPGWQVWSRVTEAKAVPVFAVGLTATIASLLGLINIGSPVAFNDLVSMSVSGLYLSYTIVASLLLYRRCTGGIWLAHGGDDEIVNTAGAKLVWGPFHMRGIVGIVINAYAVIYMIIIVFFTFWPTTIHVEAQTMNYSVVGTIGTVLLSIAYYLVRARKAYRGPIIEVSSI